MENNLTIRQLINELLKYPNLDAEAHFCFNGVNAELGEYDDHDVNIDFMEQDVVDTEYYNICLYKPNKETRSKEENNISELLEEHNKLTITLDLNDPNGNIIITNENGGVEREVKVGGFYDQSTNVIKMLQAIL